MTTKLAGELKREIEINEEPYTLTLSPTGLKLTAKGRRKGVELEWKSLVSADTSGDEAPVAETPAENP